MGPFAQSKAEPISRNASKDAPKSPVTEDEKLKMALSMVAANESKTSVTSASRIDPEETSSAAGTSANGTSPVDEIRVRGGILTKASSTVRDSSLALPPSSETPTQKESDSDASKTAAATKETPAHAISRPDSYVEAPGRSHFFGVTRKLAEQSNRERSSEIGVSPNSPGNTAHKRIPFGTLLPVRVVGSINTLRNSGGFVRMELTRPVEGEGYSYPAGTTVIGNVRGGESARAFVTIVGLIDPVSGELVKFGGELLGKDAASGIEGKRRKLTSQWARFLGGLKETASSVLGSVGALRSGGTVILSEPIRRGSESASEDLSDALLKSGKDNTFIEVSAGANGYVLVTDLPKDLSNLNDDVKAEAAAK